MQRKCRKCGEVFEPDFSLVNGDLYCEKCRGTEELADRANPANSDASVYTMRDAREKAGIAKYKMADLIGVSGVVYSRYEKNNALPDKTREKFLDALNLKPEQLNCARLQRLERRKAVADESDKQFPQVQEKNEYRYIEPVWLDALAEVMTTGAETHTDGNWKKIPAAEHMARAMRHVNLARMGDTSDNHLINASARLMMAYIVSQEK